MRKYLLGIALLTIIPKIGFSQDLLGLSTGNYAGVTGMNLNPASIVDSRLKFDLNLIGVSNYYSNNYFSVKRDALIKGSFFKDKYKDWSLVQKDLLHENKLSANERVNLRLNNRVIAPMSFMLTTGKKSAIALSIANRTGVTVNNLNQDFARLAYRRFDDAAFYGKTMDMSGIDMNVLNWLDVGFTYGRVLLDQDEHFIKAAFTAKYIGGIASGYFQSDDLSLKFNDKNNVDASTSYARYGHGEKLGFDMFKAASLKSLRPEAEGFGWNAGIVYEYRGKIDRFKYLNPESEEKLRRDKNKYTFKFGFSIMDAGKLTFKKSQLNNDFSASITDWNLKQYNIRSINDIDTMLSSRVMYEANADGYTVALPTAYSAQFDLHLGKGFYVNAMTYQPFSLFDTDKKMHVEAAYAVTPRFESRVFGLYFPVSYNKFDDWNMGATVRLGPVYFGSANLGSLVFNDKTRTADVHAGLRIPITYGSPSRLAKTFSTATRSKDKDVYNPAAEKTNVLIADNNMRYEARVDSTIIKKELEVKALEARLFELEKQRILDSIRMTNQGQIAPVSITINNYTGSGNPSVRIDTIRSVKKVQAVKESNIKVDSVNIKELNEKKQAQVDTLVRRLAERELQLKELKKKLETEDSVITEDAEPQAKVEKEKKPFLGIFKRKGKDPNRAAEDNTNNFYITEAASTQPLTRSSKNADFYRKQTKELEDEIDDLRKTILAYGAVSTAGTIGANAMISKKQAKNLEKEIERLRNDMAKYNQVGSASTNDSNQALQQEIQRLKLELAAQQGTVKDSLGDIAAIEAEIAQLRKDLQMYQNEKEPIALEAPTKFVTETIMSNEPVIDNLLSMQLEKILFNVNEVTVRPVYNNTLQFVAKSLKTYPELGLQIDGYTDKTGASAINQRLSLMRANAVKDYLLKQQVNANQLFVNNYGEKMPVANNSTLSGQILNRRVELKFVQTPLRKTDYSTY